MKYLIPVLLWLVCVFAWLTHVVVCIQSASYVLLLAGALVFPIGIVHGVGLWLHVF